MEPVTIPMRVDWMSMMRGKLANAARPSRLALLVFSVCGLGFGLSVMTQGSLARWIIGVLIAVVLLRLAVMAVSSALDGAARRRFHGTLALGSEGLELTRPDGTSEKHPWSWVLSARLDRGILALRFDERGGRAWGFFSLAGLVDRGVAEHVRAHLQQAGKL